MAKRAKLKEDVPRDLYFGPKNVKFVSTGCTILNLGISEKGDGGGWPLGRVVNIVGDKCLSGDTIVSAQRGTKPRKMTMQTLFNRVRGNHPNRGEYDTYLVADVGGYAGMAKMLDIVMSGDKVVYEVINDRGQRIKASEDHKFSTSMGWLCLSNGLTTGSLVKCWCGTRGQSEYVKKERSYTYSIPFHPFGQRNVVAGRDYKRLPTSRLVVEAAINGLPLQEFISILRNDPDTAATLQYTSNGLDVHHLDGDPNNDNIDNLQLLTPEDHWKVHAGEMAHNTRTIHLSEIVSIRKLARESTFDITMEAPHHNFVADGFVVHNSTGKTLLAEEAMANFLKQYPKGKIYYRESEAAFDTSYAKALGLNTDKVDFGPDGEDSIWDTVEDVFEDLDAILTKREKKEDKEPALYIVDSLDALTSAAEVKRDIREGSYNLNKQKMLGELFRTLIRRIRVANMCVIFVSQTRDRIGVMIRGKQYSRSGGKSLDFYASLVIYLSEIGKMTKTVGGVKRTTGIRVKFKCEKNKIVTPHAMGVFTIRFRYGIDDELSSLEYLEEVGQLKATGLAKIPPDISEVDATKLRQDTTKVWLEIERRFTPPRGKYAV